MISRKLRRSLFAMLVLSFVTAFTLGCGEQKVAPADQQVATSGPGAIIQSPVRLELRDTGSAELEPIVGYETDAVFEVLPYEPAAVREILRNSTLRNFSYKANVLELASVIPLLNLQFLETTRQKLQKHEPIEDRMVDPYRQIQPETDEYEMFRRDNGVTLHLIATCSDIVRSLRPELRGRDDVREFFADPASTPGNACYDDFDRLFAISVLGDALEFASDLDTAEKRAQWLARTPPRNTTSVSGKVVPWEDIRYGSYSPLISEVVENVAAAKELRLMLPSTDSDYEVALDAAEAMVYFQRQLAQQINSQGGVSRRDPAESLSELKRLLRAVPRDEGVGQLAGALWMVWMARTAIR